MFQGYLDKQAEDEETLHQSLSLIAYPVTMFAKIPVGLSLLCLER